MTRLSVVMSVYNGASSLEATLRSILSQTLGDFELIAVDDGSTDSSASILSAWAIRDRRLRILQQANRGLTAALIRGCEAAGSPVIARHDCGDRSHPERFATELALLEQGHVLTACTTRMVSPEGHTLYVSRAEGGEVRRSLLSDPLSKIRGLPHHGSAMFRRGAYVAAGGYRAEFRVAQDLDLWIRMAPLGTIAIAKELLYEATFDPANISATRREEQRRAAGVAIALRDGGDPAALLPTLERTTGDGGRRTSGDGHYFVARCLLAQRNPAWHQYAAAAVRRDPLHLRAWLTLLSNGKLPRVSRDEVEG